MKILKSFVVFSLLLSFFGCTSDSESDLNPPGDEPVTYTGTVKSIMSNNCIECHASPPVNSAPMPLTTYDNVKNAVLTRGLIDRISRDNGDPLLMPKGKSRLPQATIDKIVKWENDGFLE